MAIMPSNELVKAIQAYKQGDSQAFEQIYKASQPYLHKCILNVVNRTAPNAPQDLIEDVLQETCLSIAEKLQTLQSEEAYFQWAGQIATNHALRTWTKEARKQELEQPEDDLVYDLADDQFIPEDILENKEKQQLIRNMLQQLPTGQYLCLVEYFYNGLKEAEVAEKLGMPLGTVKTNLSRAKKKLREIIGDHEKKHGIKLYSLSGLFAVLLWQELSPLYAGSTAVTFGATVAGEVTAAAQVGAAGAATVAAGTTAAATSTATAAAAGATGIAVKAIAVIAAAALAVGGLTYGLNQKETSTSKSKRKPAATAPAQTEPVQTEPVVTEPDEPVMQTAGDIVLTPQALAYMNRIVEGISLPAPPTGPAISYRQGVEAPIVTEILIASCTGEKGLINGQKSGNGYIVNKSDVEDFLMNALGWIPENYFTDDYYLQAYGSDQYMIRHYSGDKAAPIVIHNLTNLDGQRVKITVTKDYTAYSCTFAPSADSPYGWILVQADDTQQKIPRTQVMHTKIFEAGIVLPNDGKEVLTAISGWGELTIAAAEARVVQYLQTAGQALPETIVAEQWGLWGNGYYTYRFTGTDANGEPLFDFLVGTVDGCIYTRDEAAGTYRGLSYTVE